MYKYTPDVFLVSAIDMNTAHIATKPNTNNMTCCPGPNAYVIAGWNNWTKDPYIAPCSAEGTCAVKPPLIKG